MTTRQSARQVALESILAEAKKESFEEMTESEWTEIVNLAWDTQSIIDDVGRRDARQRLEQILENAVVRNSGGIQ
jgi:hypothetical protein